jgi:hypothetical protein
MKFIIFQQKNEKEKQAAQIPYQEVSQLPKDIMKVITET